MAQKKLTLMISSRCKTKFPKGDAGGIELSEIRKQLKKEIEAEKFFEKPILNVWINEEETEAGSETSWDACIKQAEDCDIFIALLDGEAGWQKDKSGIGICHAEFEAAHSNAPGKVRVVSLLGDSGKIKTKSGPDLDFVNAVQKVNLLEGRGFKDAADLKIGVKNLVREMVLHLSHEGAREFSKSGPNTGQALDWSRLNFVQRQNEMSSVLFSALGSKTGAKSQGKAVLVPVAKEQILFLPTAIPAAFSVPAAREMVGQPFLRDHELADFLKSCGGPVHVIACNKSTTESQAMSLLGFPDATIVSGAFGVYVADNIQKIQLCLIANCRDAASTRHGLQRLFEWLERTGEDKLLANRALSRAKILKVMADELE